MSEITSLPEEVVGDSTKFWTRKKILYCLGVVILFVSILTLLTVCSVLYQNKDENAQQQPVTLLSQKQVKVSVPTLTQSQETPSLQVINGIPVPPEPDVTLNDSTLAGVDTNNNGVRDDVERLIAQKTSSLDEFKNALIVAGAIQKAITGAVSSQADADAYMISIACAAEKTKISLSTRDIQSAALNTSSRLSTFRANTTKFSGREIETETDCK